MPMRGSPVAVELDLAAGWPPSRAAAARRGPRSRRLSTCDGAGRLAEARGSQVSTLYPASRSDVMLSAPRTRLLSTSVSPARPPPRSHEHRRRGLAGGAVRRGNQWARITVPSNDVTSQSRDTSPALTSSAVTSPALTSSTRCRRARRPRRPSASTTVVVRRLRTDRGLSTCAEDVRRGAGSIGAAAARCRRRFGVDPVSVPTGSLDGSALCVLVESSLVQAASASAATSPTGRRRDRRWDDRSASAAMLRRHLSEVTVRRRSGQVFGVRLPTGCGTPARCASSTRRTSRSGRPPGRGAAPGSTRARRR